MDIFSKVTLKEKVVLEPQFITTDYKNEILSRIEKKVCGVCSRHGFVKARSVEILNIDYGVVQEAALNGNTIFKVEFAAEVCNPLIGCVLRAQVMKINRFGVLAECGYKDEDNTYYPIIQAIVPKNSVTVQSEYDIENIKVDEEISIEVVAKKFELGDSRIRAISRAVVNKPRGTRSVVKQNTIEEEEEYESDGGYSVNSESEEEVESEEEADEEASEKSSKSGFFSDEEEEEFFSEDSYDMFGDDENSSESSAEDI